jgi:hypothetical protein
MSIPYPAHPAANRSSHVEASNASHLTETLASCDCFKAQGQSDVNNELTTPAPEEFESGRAMLLALVKVGERAR